MQKYFEICDTDPLDFALVTKDWFDWYQTRLKCSECGHPRTEWAMSPKPIEIRLAEEVARTIQGLEAGPSCCLVHAALWEIVQPHVGKVVIHSVVVERQHDHGLREATHIAVTAPRESQVDPNRGPYCRHRMCPGCGALRNCNFRARNGILERYVSGRRAFLDLSGHIFVDEQLAIDILRNKKFDDIEMIEYETISEPLDGDVLPGDVGWSGVFHEHPMPLSDPKGSAERRRWM